MVNAGAQQFIPVEKPPRGPGGPGGCHGAGGVGFDKEDEAQIGRDRGRR